MHCYDSYLSVCNKAITRTPPQQRGSSIRRELSDRMPKRKKKNLKIRSHRDKGLKSKHEKNKLHHDRRKKNLGKTLERHKKRNVPKQKHKKTDKKGPYEAFSESKDYSYNSLSNPVHQYRRVDRYLDSIDLATENEDGGRRSRVSGHSSIQGLSERKGLPTRREPPGQREESLSDDEYENFNGESFKVDEQPKGRTSEQEDQKNRMMIESIGQVKEEDDEPADDNTDKLRKHKRHSDRHGRNDRENEKSADLRNKRVKKAKELSGSEEENHQSYESRNKSDKHKRHSTWHGQEDDKGEEKSPDRRNENKKEEVKDTSGSDEEDYENYELLHDEKSEDKSKKQKRHSTLLGQEDDKSKGKSSDLKYKGHKKEVKDIPGSDEDYENYELHDEKSRDKSKKHKRHSVRHGQEDDKGEGKSPDRQNENKKEEVKDTSGSDEEDYENYELHDEKSEDKSKKHKRYSVRHGQEDDKGKGKSPDRRNENHKKEVKDTSGSDDEKYENYELHDERSKDKSKKHKRYSVRHGQEDDKGKGKSSDLRDKGHKKEVKDIPGSDEDYENYELHDEKSRDQSKKDERHSMRRGQEDDKSIGKSPDRKDKRVKVISVSDEKDNKIHKSVDKKSNKRKRHSRQHSISQHSISRGSKDHTEKALVIKEPTVLGMPMINSSDSAELKEHSKSSLLSAEFSDRVQIPDSVTQNGNSLDSIPSRSQQDDSKRPVLSKNLRDSIRSTEHESLSKESVLSSGGHRVYSNPLLLCKTPIDSIQSAEQKLVSKESILIGGKSRHSSDPLLPSKMAKEFIQLAKQKETSKNSVFPSVKNSTDVLVVAKESEDHVTLDEKSWNSSQSSQRNKQPKRSLIPSNNSASQTSIDSLSLGEQKNDGPQEMLKLSFPAKRSSVYIRSVEQNQESNNSLSNSRDFWDDIDGIKKTVSTITSKASTAIQPIKQKGESNKEFSGSSEPSEQKLAKPVDLPNGSNGSLTTGSNNPRRKSLLEGMHNVLKMCCSSQRKSSEAVSDAPKPLDRSRVSVNSMDSWQMADPQIPQNKSPNSMKSHKSMKKTRKSVVQDIPKVVRSCCGVQRNNKITIEPLPKKSSSNFFHSSHHTV